MTTPLTPDQFFQKLRDRRGAPPYRAMFSSWCDGIVTDPALMLIPIDDHMVHRGDGVFEAIRFDNGCLYLLEAHLARLQRSASAIYLALPIPLDAISQHCHSIITASKLSDGVLRIFVGRGAGDFSPSPYSPATSELYIIACDAQPLPATKFTNGTSLVVSHVPMKPPPFSGIKSLNYLPNVLTYKDALDRNADFAVNVTPEGLVGEGPTENIAILSAAGELLAPLFDYTLRGTTLERVFTLAESHQATLGLMSIGYKQLTVTDLHEAREIMMIGTTREVCPVTNFEGANVGDGKVGPIAKSLRKVLLEDMHGVRFTAS